MPFPNVNGVNAGVPKGGNSLEASVLTFVRQRLTDPELSARQIADAHAISVRYLYKILSGSGISLGAWIRDQRLELCRVALEDDGERDRTIAAIAHGAGFGDLTHFSRAFKKAYGVTPRDYRSTPDTAARPAGGSTVQVVTASRG